MWTNKPFAEPSDHLEPHRVATTESLEFISADDINRFEAESNYTPIHLAYGKSLPIAKMLKHPEGMVEGMGFPRAHDHHLVNVRNIKRMPRGEPACLVMQEGSTVPVPEGIEEIGWSGPE